MIAAPSVLPKRNGIALQNALAGLHKLVARYDEIVAFNTAVLTVLAGYGKRLQAARAELNAAMRAMDLERTRKAIEDLVSIRSCAQFADEEFRSLNHAQATGGSMTQFLAENGDAKRVLLDACQARLAKAQKNYDEVYAAEAQRMGPSFDADDSPVTKRAKGLVTRRQHQLQRIMESPIADVFVNFARQLYESASVMWGSYRAGPGWVWR